MFKFFKISVYISVSALFALSLLTLSDVFIHSNALRFYLFTVITALLFFTFGFLGIIVYKNSKNVYEFVLKEGQHSIAKVSITKLLLIFGLIAIGITLLTCLLCVGLLERMRNGTALLG